MDQTNYSVFEKYYSVFARAQLCHGISLDQFEIILTMLDATVKSYRKNEIIFPEGSEQTHFGMILKGELLHSRINLSGERVIFERLRAGQLFGEEKLFSRHHQ